MMLDIWATLPVHDSDTMARFIAGQTEGIPFAANGKMVLLARICHDKGLKEELYTHFVQSDDFYGTSGGLAQEAGKNNKLSAGLEAVPKIDQAIMQTLPLGSFSLQFDFALTSHWYSKDDTPLYPLKNPVRKEWVFKAPEQGAAGWKGAFLQACRRLEIENSLSPEAMGRLFGTAKDGDDDDGVPGRLHFFPSFFDQIELYVINPHGRETRAGKHPIYIETVPPGATSSFTLLYLVPDSGAHEKELRKDRNLIARIVKEVFEKQGFGAKTSLGFGRAQIRKAKAANKPGKTDEPRVIVRKNQEVIAKGFQFLGAACAKKTGDVAPVPAEKPQSGNRLLSSDESAFFSTFDELEKLLAGGNHDA